MKRKLNKIDHITPIEEEQLDYQIQLAKNANKKKELEDKLKEHREKFVLEEIKMMRQVTQRFNEHLKKINANYLIVWTFAEDIPENLVVSVNDM